MTDEVIQGIKNLAKGWSESIRNKSNENLGKYKSLIRVVSRVVYPKNGIAITATAQNIARDEYGEVKRVARAYEYGSGIHRRQFAEGEQGEEGDIGTYVIKPKRKKLLAFYWDVLGQAYEMEGKEGVDSVMQYSPKYRGIASEPDEAGRPRFLFKYVDHPGVEAANHGKGYMRPAFESVRRQIRKEVPPEFRKQFIKRFRKHFA